MACLFSATGAASARPESSAGAAAVEIFMVKKVVESAKLGSRLWTVEEE